MKYRLIFSLFVYLALYSASLLMAFLLRFDLELDQNVARRMTDSLALVLMVKLTIFVAMGEWQRRHRYTTFHDTVSFVMTSTMSSLLITGAYFLGLFEGSLPRTVIAIDWIQTILLTGLLRAFLRFASESLHRKKKNSHQLRAVIYGADSMSIAILKALSTY